MFTKRGWLVFGVLTVLMAFAGGLLVNAARSARAAAVHSSNQGRFCQIWLALLNYHDFYGEYPPVVVRDDAGRPMHSWRVFLLRYLEQGDLADAYRFDEPWDGPHNRRLIERVPSPFVLTGRHTDPRGVTGIVAVLGRPPPCPVEPGYEEWTAGDGVVIGLIEANGLDVPWTKPEDITAEQLGKIAAEGRFRSLSHCGVGVVAGGLGRTPGCGGVRLAFDTPAATLLDGSAFCGDNSPKPAAPHDREGEAPAEPTVPECREGAADGHG